MEKTQIERDPFGIYGNIYRTVDNDICCFYGNRQGLLHQSDFEELRLTNDILVLSPEANQNLVELAIVIRNYLIQFFHSIDQDLKDYHRKSPWAHLTYAEFFIWWYHFLYTTVTDALAKAGDLKIPESGMYAYIIRAS